MAWANEPASAGMDADLRAAARRRHRARPWSARRGEPFLDARQRGQDIGGREIAQWTRRRSSGPESTVAVPDERSATAAARTMAGRELTATQRSRRRRPTWRAASPTCKLERDAVAALRGPGRPSSATPSAQGRLPGHRQPTSVVTPSSGPTGCSRPALDVPALTPPRWRVRAVLASARVFGTKAVSSMVQGPRGRRAQRCTRAQDLEGPEMVAIAADEREHAAIWKRLGLGMLGVEPATRRRSRPLPP